MSRSALAHLAAALGIAVLAAALYAPFLDNPRVFDDVFFFSGRKFAYYATHPLGLELRVPGYFTLAVTEVLWSGVMEAQRIVGLVLHVLVALALYRLLLELQRATLPAASDADASLRAAIGAAAFALHPVAVYGAGYLVQRTIVMATLFALLSAFLFLRGARRRSHADALSAALLYSLAVLSKEHAVLLPAAVASLAVLAGAARPFAVRHIAIYFAACAPAAVFVTLLSLGVIGGAYEEAAAAIAAQAGASASDIPVEPSLALSAATQAGLFLKYLGLWLWPDPAGMSIDLRVDFAAGWTPAWIVVKVAAFIACGIAAGALLLRRGALGLAGFGLLYAWILYLVEFSAVRLQEPFVLYRSYLWGPGMACVAVAALSRLPQRAAMVAGLLACALLAHVAHGRLVTFSSPLLLWQDAEAKLPELPVPWGSRVLYQVGREYLYAGQPRKAMDVAERCARQYPRTVHCVYMRGAIHLHQQQFELALRYFQRALELQPGVAYLHHRLGLALEGLDRLDEARVAYRRAIELGHGPARLELQRLERGERRWK
jgi:tetratricopeptide (TPR) repeat protein